MSHFTVTVIGQDYEDMLAGYYEQGDEHDWFMEFLDCTEEVEADFHEKEIEVRLFPDRTYNFEFNYKGTSIPDRSDKRYTPSAAGIDELPWPKNGFKKFTVFAYQLYENMDAIAEDWFGYQKNAEGRYGYFHNPNAKWDWYQMGGRWTGALKMLPVPEEDRKEIPVEQHKEILAKMRQEGLTLDQLYEMYQAQPWDEWLEGGKAGGFTEEEIEIIIYMIRYRYYPAHSMGEPGVFGLHGPRRPDYADQVQAKNIDWVGMQADHVASLEAAYLARRDEMLEKGEFPDDCRISLGFLSEARDYWETIESAQCAATFALLDHSGWHESGEMGWFGMSSNNKAKYDWNAIYRACIEAADPDEWVTVVDCHI